MGCGSSQVPRGQGNKVDFSKAPGIGPNTQHPVERKAKKKRPRPGGGGGGAGELSESDDTETRATPGKPAAGQKAGGGKKNAGKSGKATAGGPDDVLPENAAAPAAKGKKSETGGARRRSSTEGDKPPPTAEDHAALRGKSKYLPAPVVNEVRDGGAGHGPHHAAVFPHLSDMRGLTVAVRNPAGTVYARQFTDQQLSDLRSERKLEHNWPSFWKALAGAFVKGSPKVRSKTGGESVTIDIILSSTKEPKHQPFPLDLEKVGSEPAATSQYFLDPFQGYHVHSMKDGGKKIDFGDRRDESRYWQVEAAVESYQRRIATAELLLKTGQDDLKRIEDASGDLLGKLSTVEAVVRRLRTGAAKRNHIDEKYDVCGGGAHSFEAHTPHRQPYDPKEVEPNTSVMALIQNRFPLPGKGDPALREMAEDRLSKHLSARPTASDPVLQEVLAGAPDESHWAVMKCFEKLDRWDYDVFAVAQNTNNGALFHTAYALLHKYDLVSQFGIDNEVLVRFLTAVQSGYRPNWYHNSTHAADVLHITHFCLGPGGMARMLHVSPEHCLAAIIASTVHDYDHPGFNNNFHTRTSAYLSTLYNDRSILENHHCASIFEMMQLPRYNILLNMSEDQRKEVRDAVVDMLLSTDMGNHAKIFSSFRRRLNESDDWERREDVRLALIMAIKMADISNCGRPLRLYLQWAKNIATEFYLQGDAELKLKLSISPFMDRRKDKTDFSKGQISFINFIVVPLFEAMAELLPNLEFTVKQCQQNKDHWAKDPECGSGAAGQSGLPGPPAPRLLSS